MLLHFKPGWGAPGQPLSRMGQHAAPIWTYIVPCHSQSYYERETGICRNNIHHRVWLAEINCTTRIPQANFGYIGRYCILQISFEIHSFLVSKHSLEDTQFVTGKAFFIFLHQNKEMQPVWKQHLVCASCCERLYHWADPTPFCA